MEFGLFIGLAYGTLLSVPLWIAIIGLLKLIVLAVS